jgi:hypothetical protein
MSSSTTLRYTPPPPPPPKIETDLHGSIVTDECRLFGQNGCTSLKQTLAELCRTRPSDPVLTEFRKRYPWKQADLPPTGDVQYELTLGEADLPPTVRALGVEALKATLALGRTLIRTGFRHTVVGDRALTKSEVDQLTGDIQRAVNRQVNQVAALAVVRQHIKPKVEVMVGQRVQQQVKHQFSNDGVHRLTATYRRSL